MTQCPLLGVTSVLSIRPVTSVFTQKQTYAAQQIPLPIARDEPECPEADMFPPMVASRCLQAKRC